MVMPPIPTPLPPVHQQIGLADSSELANPELLQGVLTIGSDCNPQARCEGKPQRILGVLASMNMHTGLEADKGIVSKGGCSGMSSERIKESGDG